MDKLIRAITKRRRGRPVTTGKGTLIGVRLLDDPLATLDAWIARQKEPNLSRPEAIRRLVELGLKVKTPAMPDSKPGRKLRAQELPAKVIEKMIAPSAPPENERSGGAA